MSADLRFRSMFAATSLVVMDDCLVLLEHGYSRDRVKRFMFDSIESVLIWNTVPWVRIAIIGFVFGLPGGILLFFGSTATNIIGAILVIVAVLALAWYFYCGQTSIRISRSGKTVEFKSIIARPGKVRRFRDRLVAGIQRVQAASIARMFPGAAAGIENVVPIPAISIPENSFTQAETPDQSGIV